MNRKNGFRCFFILLFCLLFMAACTSLDKNNKLKHQEKRIINKDIEKQDIPTIFLHGYKGGKSSFGGMIFRLDRQNIGSKSVRLTVTEDGKIEEEGNWKRGGNPLIQVVFKDNTNTEWQQSEWIGELLDYLHVKHAVEKVRLVGHSMGGVSTLRYLTSNKQVEAVKVDKFVAIGAPFNEFFEDDKNVSEIEAAGPSIQSVRFSEYENNFINYPTACTFLNIAGDVEANGKSDGTVPVSSVVAINFLFKKSNLPYHYEQIIGEKAQHSALHENIQVDEIVSDFLWN